MKTFSIIILVIVVAVLAFFGLRKDENLPQVNENATSTPIVITDGTYTVSSSTIVWSGKKTLISGYVDSGMVEVKSGSFTVAGGAVTSGAMVVDMNTIAVSGTGRGSGESQLEKHLKSKDFFDVAVFPESRLVINGMEEGMVNGDLTIKGITKPVQFPVMVEEEGNAVKVTGVLTVDRTVYDVRFGSSKFFDDLADNVIDDMFALEFEIVGTR
ncbi:MAG: YceI family protein [bacterium]|nr:YceI family protein [bacterium]